MNPEVTRAVSKDGSTRAAAAVLHRIFSEADPGIQYRLWNGSVGRVGAPDGSFTIVIRDPETFVRAFSTTDTKVLAEAFVENRIDVEGDLFNCLRIGNQLDDTHLGWRDRLAIWRDLRRVAA